MGSGEVWGNGWPAVIGVRGKTTLDAPRDFASHEAKQTLCTRS